jgi:hypothetical protein
MDAIDGGIGGCAEAGIGRSMGSCIAGAMVG